MTDLLALDDAIAQVLAHARPLSAETVALDGALGRVLAADARAAVDLPPFASSAMDGFALRSEDTPGSLPVVDRVAAGRPVSRELEPGEAIGIATGGAVPDGADAVVPIERVVEADNDIVVESSVASGANIRPRGGDVRAGDAVIAAGTRLTAVHLAALAAAGLGSVECATRPRVAVVATGTELRRPGERLEPGEIYESNTVLLTAALVGAGAEVASVTWAVDTEDAHRRELEAAIDADVVITSGGVSVGPHDLVRRVLADLGVRERFWRVAVKPGKPVSFGTRDATLVFGLPGNPVSVLAGFELFVRPALRALQGERDPGPRYERGRLVRAVRRSADRDELVRARRTGGLLEPVTGQESHMIVRAATADALVHVPRGEGELAEGADVAYLPLAL